MSQVVTQLIVDARGAEQGSAAYVRAMKAAQSAADASLEREAKLQGAIDKTSAVLTRGAGSVSQISSRWDRLVASVDPVAAAHQKAARVIEDATLRADAAVRRGLATQQDAARVIDAVRAKQIALTSEIERGTIATNDNSAAAARMRAQWSSLSSQGSVQEKAFQAQEKLNAQFRTFSAQGAAQARAINVIESAQASSTKATALHAGAWQNLGFQVNDTLTSLASGASPMQVIAQQGGQIYQALDGPKGVTGGLKEVGNFLLGLLTPARLAVGGLAAIGVTAVASAASWQSAQSDIRQALAGVGRGAGATVGDIESIARATADATDQSVGSSRALALELAKTGKIAKDNLQPITALGKNFVATVGGDAAEANQLLARSFAEPGRGAEDLARRYNLLDDQTVRYVRSLEDANDRTRAQQALLDALRPRLTNASDLTSGWAAAWERLKRAASDAYDAVGKAVDRASGGAGGRSEADQIAGQEQLLSTLRGRRSVASDFDTEGLDRQIIAAEARLKRLQDGVRQVEQRVATEAKVDLSLRAGLIARAAVPETGSLDDLTAKRKTLNDAIAAGGPIAKESALAITRLDAALKDYTDAGGATALMERKKADASQNSLAALKAMTPEQVGQIAAERERINLPGSQTSQSERSAQVERARAEAIAGAQKQIDEQNQTLDRSTQSSNRVAEAWRTSGEAAAMKGEAARKAAEDVAKGLQPDEEAGRQAKYLKEQISSLRKERAQATAQMNAETAVEEKLNRAVDDGKISREQANDARQREVEIARLIAQASVAEGADRTAILQQVDELTSAYQRQSAAKADAAAQGMIADQDRQLAQLRLEAELVGKSTQERERALAVLRAQQELQRQGIPLSSEKGRQYIDNAGLLSDINVAKREYERLAQEISGVVSGIFDDIFSRATDGSRNLIDNITRSISRLGSRFVEQNLISPMLGGQSGGMLGGGSSIDFGKLFNFGGVERAVEKGSESGITSAFGPLLEPQKDASGNSKGILSSPLGGALGSGLAGGSIGYQTQSPLLGAIGGGISGYAMGGPVGAVVGAGAGLLGGIFGNKEAERQKEEQRKKEREAAKSAYDSAKSQIDQLMRTLKGEAVGGLQGQISDATKQVTDAAKIAREAHHEGEARRLEAALQGYIERLRVQFVREFEGMLSDLDAGQGLDGPFSRAASSIKAFGESLKNFVNDAELAAEKASGKGTAGKIDLPPAFASLVGKLSGSLGGALSGRLGELLGGGTAPASAAQQTAAQDRLNRARQSAQQAALGQLDAPEQLSAVATRMREIAGTGAGLRQVLVDLGMSATQAAKAIRDRTKTAIDALRQSFDQDIGKKLNDATGKGYLNDAADLVKEIATARADATLVGGNRQQVEDYYAAAAQKIVDESQITGAAFTDLAARFPDLKGRLHEFSEALDSTADQAAIATRKLAYQDRAFAAGLDTNTQAGALAAFDRQAQRQREEEAKTGGQATADLEKALGAERLAIVKDFATRAAEAEKAAAQAAENRAKGYADRLFAAGNNASTLEGQLAAYDRQAAREREEEIDAGGKKIVDLEAAQYAERARIVRDFNEQAVAAERQRADEAASYLSGALKNIKGFLDDLTSGQQSPLSPADRLAAAQSQFDEQLALARGGDRDALSGITGRASTLIDASRAMNASGPDFQADFQKVTDALKALPKLVSPEQFIADAIGKAANDNAAGQLSLLGAIQVNSPVAIASALDANFGRLDTNLNGKLSGAEFLAGLGPLATKEQQAAALTVFKAIDLDGDGQITRLELLRSELKASLDANPALIQKALNLNFTALDTTMSGRLTQAQFVAGLGPLATKAEQDAAELLFKSMDANGDGLLSKTELMRGQLVAGLQANSPGLIAAALSTNFDKLDTTMNGRLSKTEYLAGLGPLATKAEQDAAELLFRSIDANGDGQLDKLELLRTVLKSAIEANSPAAIATALNANFNMLDRNLDGKLSSSEFRTGLGPLATEAEQTASRVIFKSLDSDSNGQLSKLELIRAQAAYTSANTGDTKTSVDATKNAVNDNTAVSNAMQALLKTINSYTSATQSNTAATKASVDASKAAVDAGAALTKTSNSLLDNVRTYSDLTRQNVATGNRTLDAINGLSGIQRDQLIALNGQFKLNAALTLNGKTLNNNMVTALNKIVYNTANAIVALKSDGKYGENVFASGGWVRGPGTATSDSITSRLSNGEFVVNAASARMNAGMLEAMNDNRSFAMPAVAMPVPMMGGGGDAASAAEIRALRAELKAALEMLARVTKGSGDKVAAATGKVQEEVAGVREDGKKTGRSGFIVGREKAA